MAYIFLCLIAAVKRVCEVLPSLVLLYTPFLRPFLSENSSSNLSVSAPNFNEQQHMKWT